MVVWADDLDYDIYGARVDLSGDVLDSGGILVSSARAGSWAPAIATDGVGYLVAWEQMMNGSPVDVYCARLSSEGDLLDRESIPVAVADGAQRGPAIAFDGANYMIAWEDRSHSPPGAVVRYTRISRDGKVLDPPGIPVPSTPGDQSAPCIAFNGTDYLIVWECHGEDSDDLYGALIDPSGSPIYASPMSISTSRDWQASPAVASDGVNFMVVWRDSRSGTYDQDIYGARIGRSGAVLDEPNIPISTAPRRQMNPSLTFDGRCFVVAWEDERRHGDWVNDIYAARVDPSGNVLDPDGLVVSADDEIQESAAIAANGAQCLIVWQDTRGKPYGTDIYGSRLDQSGRALDGDGRLISVSSNTQLYPSSASCGAEYMVVWQDQRGGSSDVYCSRVAPSGKVLDRRGVLISTSAGYQSWPGIASNGRGYLVAWADERRGSSDADVYCARLTASGEVEDPEGILVAGEAGMQAIAGIASDGANYLVVWSRNADGWLDYDLYCTRVDPSGVVLDPEGILLSERPGVSGMFDVTYGGGNYVVVWSGSRDNSREIGAARIDPSGAVLDPAGISVALSDRWVGYPAVAFDGENFAVAWDDERGGSHDIHAARMDPFGNVLDTDPIVVCSDESLQQNPAICFDGARYVILWRDSRAASQEIYGALLDPSGQVLDRDLILMSGAPSGPPGFSMTRGQAGQMLITYSSFNQGPGYGSYRILGNLWNPQPDGSRVRLDLAPNPFRTRLNIGFALPGGATVRVAVFDAAGRLVKTVAHGYRGPGRHEETWDGTDEEGRSVPDGVYFAGVRSKFGEASEKCMLVR
jgi:hypothetical protein